MLLSDLKFTYDLSYLHEIVNYGKYIGAEAAYMKDGQISLYYKKGDKNSKHCAYNFDPTDSRLMHWKNSYNTCYEQAVNFCSRIGWKVELIFINEIQLPALPVE